MRRLWHLDPSFPLPQLRPLSSLTPMVIWMPHQYCGSESSSAGSLSSPWHPLPFPIWDFIITSICSTSKTTGGSSILSSHLSCSMTPTNTTLWIFWGFLILSSPAYWLDLFYLHLPPDPILPTLSTPLYLSLAKYHFWMNSSVCFHREITHNCTTINLTVTNLNRVLTYSPILTITHLLKYVCPPHCSSAYHAHCHLHKVVAALARSFCPAGVSIPLIASGIGH